MTTQQDDNEQSLTTINQEVSYHAVVERKNTHISAVVDVIPSNDRVPMVFHPDPSQSIV